MSSINLFEFALRWTYLYCFKLSCQFKGPVWNHAEPLLKWLRPSVRMNGALTMTLIKADKFYQQLASSSNFHLEEHKHIPDLIFDKTLHEQIF
jgi:hypothetical protein